MLLLILQFEDGSTLDSLLDTLFDSFDCDGNGSGMVEKNENRRLNNLHRSELHKSRMEVY